MPAEQQTCCGRRTADSPASRVAGRGRRRALLITATVALLLTSLPGAAAGAEVPPGNSRPVALSSHGPIDVLVYGGTPGGVIAAVAAARAGADVALIEPSAHVGGMMSNGLSWTDRGDVGVIGGIVDEFFDRTQALEGSVRGRYAFQPKTAEAVFKQMLSQAGVTVYYGERLAEGGGAVTKSGTRITAIRLESGASLAAHVFIDASYEGDLLARAGVAYRVGREAVEEFGEPLAGVRPAQVVMSVPPGLDPGFPLSAPGPVGSADERIQGSNYRLCLSTNAANQVPFPQPAGYDPARYDINVEYWSQLAASGQSPNLHWAMHVDLLVNQKWDLNEFALLSLGLPGANHGYPEGTYAQRTAIDAYHEDYQKGFLYFLANDPNVPSALQDQVNAFGLCADEFTDNESWPRLLYLREGRRMVGRHVLTQLDIGTLRSKPDIIGMASYRLDSHAVSRWIDGQGRLVAEGSFGAGGVSQRWAIPYRSITPERAQASNLLVPVAAAASHVAHASLRMEPSYMIMGQAAGTAAAMAAASGTDVQVLSVSALQNALKATGSVLTDPGDIGTSTFYSHIVWAYFEGIIAPCAPGKFCPTQAVTRAMMADFLVPALDLPPASQDYFTDDNGHPSEDNINRVAEAGITLGCTTTTYCPSATVTRAQMASFLTRAWNLPPTSQDFFTDDETFTSHEDDINSIAAVGITTGCTPTTYCPGKTVTRGEMMAFVHRATIWAGS